MGRQITKQYSISSGQTSEKALDVKDEVKADIVRALAPSSNASDVYVGNDGSDAVDNNSGYPIPPGEKESIRLDDPIHGERSDLYVYGDSGDEIYFIAIG